MGGAGWGCGEAKGIWIEGDGGCAGGLKNGVTGFCETVKVRTDLAYRAVR
jgi:hypothetical protein